MKPEVSVVIPMRNEAPNVDDLHRELTSALHRCGRPYEIIVVDDGSDDDTFAALARLRSVELVTPVIGAPLAIEAPGPTPHWWQESGQTAAASSSGVRTVGTAVP